MLRIAPLLLRSPCRSRSKGIQPLPVPRTPPSAAAVSSNPEHAALGSHRARAQARLFTAGCCNPWLYSQFLFSAASHHLQCRECSLYLPDRVRECCPERHRQSCLWEAPLSTGPAARTRRPRSLATTGPRPAAPKREAVFHHGKSEPLSQAYLAAMVLYLLDSCSHSSKGSNSSSSSSSSRSSSSSLSLDLAPMRAAAQAAQRPRPSVQGLFISSLQVRPLLGCQALRRAKRLHRSRCPGRAGKARR
mmetsp:Transcript_77491/g.134436  ORF Transcript_77491/g.134436 Transcript_77491/m.134436 type:complete len:247 (-) Transcript_77491:414-1154(-)